MLLKLVRAAANLRISVRFSTLYRVDAIEAVLFMASGLFVAIVSVPSIGSMLLKHDVQPADGRRRVVFQYPLSGRCY